MSQYKRGSQREQELPTVIKTLISRGKIREDLIHIREDGSEEFAEIQCTITSAIADARRWGAYYERCRRVASFRTKEFKKLADVADKQANKLDTFARNYAGQILNVAEHAAPDGHALSPSSISGLLHDISRVATQLKGFSGELTNPLHRIGGRPSDDYLLGFIWSMAWCWRELTTVAITPRGFFTKFLEETFTLSEPKHSLIEWETLTKTAIRRFQLRTSRWRRPGDDIDLFPMSG